MEKSKRSFKKAAIYIRVLIISQMILGLALLGARYLAVSGWIEESQILSADNLLLLVLFFLFLNTAIILLDNKRLYMLSHEVEVKSTSLKEIQDLNHQLRGQRHDFLNHIQVLYSLMELNEYEEVGAYLNELYGDIEGLNQYIKTDHAAINALLLAKAQTASQQNTEYKVIIGSKLSGLSMPQWEMCRCLGNLIDNAFAILLKRDTLRQVVIQISEDIRGYRVQVRNNGEPIPSGLVDRIFRAGFTTKSQSEGHGMGLHIVETLVEKYKGTIQVDSNDKHTTFTMILPKKG